MKSLKRNGKEFFKLELKMDKNQKDCLERTISTFCDSGKKEDAFSVYFAFSEIFKVFGTGYDSMQKLLEFLADHEYHSGELLMKHRDHYSHSVYVFVLGLAIYSQDEKVRSVFKNFYKNQNFSHLNFLYNWGLVALFHDIGYPFQLAHEQIKAYTAGVFGNDDKSRPFVSYENMNELLNSRILADENVQWDISQKNVCEMIAFAISKRLGYSEEVVLDLLNNRYRNQPNFMDHGYFSSILLAKQLLDNNVKITEELLDVLAAIALHNNLNRFDLKKVLGYDTAIDIDKHPLAYLIILCDELQNWDRQAFGVVSKKDPLAWTVKLDISDKGIDIQYVFDSLNIIFPIIKKDHNGNLIINEDSRENLNVTKLKGDCEFVKDLSRVIRLHTGLIVSIKKAKKQKRTSNFISSNKFINLCDFAKAIHKSYAMLQQGKEEREIESFEELSLEFKLSNIEQAKSYTDKLELINCFYSDQELEYPIVNRFHETKKILRNGQTIRDDLGFLAREEHVRWVKEKLQNGWKYGKQYVKRKENGHLYDDIKLRNKLKVHKDIIPYDLLSEEEKEKDRLMIRNMIPLLYKHGNGVRIYSYRDGRKPVLNIAGCGHRTINRNQKGLKKKIKEILTSYMKEYRVVVRTNFAFGADQLIAKCANELGITIKATLPLSYEEYIAKIKEDSQIYNYNFSEKEEMEMRHLLAQTVSCKVKLDDKYTYLEASKYIINKSDKLIALWDGVETKLKDEKGNPINQGGTYHNIIMAEKSRGLKRDKDIHIIHCER